MIELAMSPLQLDALSRDYYGHWDAYATERLAPLARRLDCYQPKFYKAPASSDELIPAFGFIEYGLRITPGSLIFGFFVPALVSSSNPPQYNVQVIDTSIKIGDKLHTFWDEPIPSIFLGNYKPTYLTADALQANGLIGSAPSLQLLGPALKMED